MAGYIGSKAVNLSTTGADINGDANIDGNLSFRDNDKAIFGAGSDLQIYHTGTYSLISEEGTGSLVISTNGNNIQLAKGATELMLVATPDADVKLYYDNAVKLATTSTGVDITGTLTSDGLTVSQENPKITITDTGTGADHELNGASSIGNLTLNFDKNDEGSSPYFYIQHAGSKLAAFRKGGDISFYEDTGTTAKFFWDASAESLGIGTSSPNYQIDIESSSPSARLNSTVNNGVNTIWFGHSDDADAGAIRYWGSAAGLGTYANAMTFNTNGSQVMHLDSSGNVGIGTSSPSLPFHVLAGSNNTSVARFTGAQLNRGLTISTYSSGGLNDGGVDLDADNSFKVTTNGSEAMRIDSSGNVGIGTSSPASDALLHVDGTNTVLLITEDSEGDATLRLGDTQGNLSQSMSLSYDTGSTNALKFIANGTTERMRIDSSGNLLVGKTSAVDSTDGVWIDGGGRVFSTNTDQYAAQFRRNGTDGIVVYFLNDAALAGNISVSGSTTAYNTSSDYRLKTDVQAMTGATNRLQQLNPVNFEWIAEGTRVDGFLAHEVQDIVPEAIIGTHNEVDADGNPVYQGIDQAKLVPLLTAALQEALDEITDLKARVATLEAN